MQRARSRNLCRLLLISILIGLLVGAIAPHACHASSIRTRADLLATLIRLRAQYPEWVGSYRKGVYDCSNMASRLHRILTSEGFVSFIVVGWQIPIVYLDGARMRYDLPTESHAKLLVYVWSGGKVEPTWVEATLLGVTTRRFLPRHVFNGAEEANRVYQGEF